MDAFQPGDLVQLKSGGPIMTVEEMSNYSGVRASWFTYGKRHKESFEAASLQPAAAPQARPFGTRPGAPALP
jgi:uncharacterized protein YodC (DUF2158 family)